jgi:hypothetical protein
MAKSEKTGSKVARRQATKVLRDGRSSTATKSLAGSALSQSRTKKESSARTATVAAKVLGAKSSTKNAKSLAGSVLTQRSGSAFPVKSFAVVGSSLSKAERSAAVRKVTKKK